MLNEPHVQGRGNSTGYYVRTADVPIVAVFSGHDFSLLIVHSGGFPDFTVKVVWGWSRYLCVQCCEIPRSRLLCSGLVCGACGYYPPPRAAEECG